MMTDISSLPDFTALKKLASALWQQENSYHGAAIMVGAGFSRSAASTGDANRKLPLWNDFSKSLAKELDSSSSDPLRLAEEYCAYFGKQTLHDLIKTEVNDAAWTPGDLYKSLLELPWTEVLTTNWDTLLERASLEVHQPVYSIVTKQEDLSSARSPRIVKLHGTIDVTKDLIFTQEDYRKYPLHHAAFVNFSRQVFIENELCLLGFSGDDPNFLQWAGWVRDNLETNSRRIYLVGALGLNSAKRKYLESINIAPIDLNDLVSDLDELDSKHLEATKIFFQALQKLKPKPNWEWTPTTLHRATTTNTEITRTYKDSEYAAKLLTDSLPSLEKDRMSYPSWLVCPNSLRFLLQHQISSPWPNAKNLSAMTGDNRAQLLYEIAWQHSVTYEIVPSWLVQELLTICDPDKPCALNKKQQLEITLLLLKNTRWIDDPETDSITEITSNILAKGNKYWPECSDELAYYNAILARDKFDYESLEKLVDKITSTAPIWKLRKASLFVELGELEKGEELVSNAYRELMGQYRYDQNSIYVLSRLAWAHWLIRGVELDSNNFKSNRFPVSYQEPKCSPLDHIESIRDRITKELNDQQKQQLIEPSFEPGHYKDHSNTVTFNNELHPLILLEGITYTVGMPLRWGNVSFLVDQATRITELKEIDNIYRFVLAIRAANSDSSDVLKKVFSRIQIACLPEKDVSFLLNQCTKAINYWSEIRKKESGNKIGHYALDRLRVFIEVLARVSVRSTPEQAKEIFRLALSFSQKSEFQHSWLCDTLKHLAEFALNSIPEQQHSDILLEALLFPLKAEVGISDHTTWVNPEIRQPGKRTPNKAIDRRIDEIIDNISPCSVKCTPALLRLLPLIERKFLTNTELDKIAQKLWGENPDYKTLPDTGLFKFTLLKLPSSNPSAVKALVRLYLFESQDNALFNQERLEDIANASQAENIKEFPTEIQAKDYFEKLVAWRIQENENDLLGFTKQKDQQLAELIGRVLARSVVPSLPLSELTEENYQKLSVFYDKVDTSEVLIAFPYFAVANDALNEQIENLLKESLQSKDAKKLAYASYAVLKWRDLKESPASERLTFRLINLIGLNRLIGLPALLWTVRQMYCQKYLSDTYVVSLIEILPVIFDSARYNNVSPYSRESVSISIVRAACVRLAQEILRNSQDKNAELIKIMEKAKQDALPEVRFAEITDD